MNRHMLIFCLGVIVFVITSLYNYSDICCMFSASRYYGWPYPYLSLQKTVDTLEEANQIKTGSVSELIKNGWQFHFSGDILRSGPFGTVGNFVLDATLSFISAFLLVLAGQKLFPHFFNINFIKKIKS